MCQKANELYVSNKCLGKWVVRKQQRPAQRQPGMLKAFMINFILIILCCLEQCVQTDFAENILARKKIQIKALFRSLGTKISSYEEFHCKTTQISEGNELYPAKSK